ncbi:chaperone modulator CbpM [Sinorhizobium sp. BG8]|uniref:chaperone modulator CbpM n=1 Tax=Sinorhizobium sp. BG8 TaxID=2613773 RepID=UPI00193DAAA9|nr:chaperone modulator CbpM [Sinorhizobium sp. BG8]QRM55216.1 MerR family transcriptional regulator [Sinorhizobium sp. BG8]
MDDTEFCRSLEIEVSVLRVWIEQRWLLPRDTEGAAVFEEADLARARLIQDLSGPMGVNSPGVDVAMHLLDQIHDLRGRLTEVLAAIREQDQEIQERILSTIERR